MTDRVMDEGTQPEPNGRQLRPVLGLREEHRGTASRLFWQAFSQKLGLPLGPQPRALAFIERVLDAEHAIYVASEQGELLGVAGFKTSKGAFVGGSYQDLAAIYGTLGASWRAALLSLLERSTDDSTLLMDGIFVASEARGQGIGTILLRAIEQHASALQKNRVRLDVIDTNPRARALYERCGYRPDGVLRTGPLRLLLGFAAATTMYKNVPPLTCGLPDADKA